MSFKKWREQEGERRQLPTCMYELYWRVIGVCMCVCECACLCEAECGQVNTRRYGVVFKNASFSLSIKTKIDLVTYIFSCDFNTPNAYTEQSLASSCAFARLHTHTNIHFYSQLTFYYSSIHLAMRNANCMENRSE